jgi:hypothetical protein
MRFKCIESEALPKLAWCSLLNAGNDEVTVYHGSMVEVSSDFMVAGAWSGSYDHEGFATACTVSGTGGYLFEDSVCFKSSSDYFSPLFTIKKDDCLYISNSIVFLMSASGEEPHPLYPFYAYDILRIVRAGLDGIGGTLPTNSRHKIHVYIMSTLRVDSQLTLTQESLPSKPDLNTYEDYHDLLVSELRGLIDNAEDSKRKQPVAALCTTSRGYDSVAVTSIAAKAGCTRAVTINDSRAANPEEDNGTEICHLLGMQCTTYERWSYLDHPEFAEHYLAFTGLGNTPVYASMIKDFRNSLLLFASNAEEIWSSKCFILSDRMHNPQMRSLSGLNDLEFRLEIGFLKFNPSFIEIIQNRKIAEISESDDLKQWSIGGEYDRPIPRRIAEESGIPRHMFGFNKMASGHASFSFEKNMSKKAFENYSSFVQKSHANQPRMRFLFWRFISIIENRIYSNFYLKRQKPHIVMPNRLRWVALNCRRRHIAWNQRFIYQWAFAMLSNRYKIDEMVQ